MEVAVSSPGPSSPPSCRIQLPGGLRVTVAGQENPRSLFPELMALDGHEGARRVIQAHPDETVVVPFPEGAFDNDMASSA
jgi:hypothetical protein